MVEQDEEAVANPVVGEAECGGGGSCESDGRRGGAAYEKTNEAEPSRRKEELEATLPRRVASSSAARVLSRQEKLPPNNAFPGVTS